MIQPQLLTYQHDYTNPEALLVEGLGVCRGRIAEGARTGAFQCFHRA